MIFDGHSDLLFDVTRRRLLNGEQRVLERQHLERLRRGRIEGVVLALWVSDNADSFWEQLPDHPQTAAERVEKMLTCGLADLAECPAIRLVRTAQEAVTARTQGAMYAFLGMEGMTAVGNDVTAVDRYAQAGVRLGMLTWNEANQLATGAGGSPDTGLTPLGRQVVRRMGQAGMRLDVSHLNDGGFWEAISLADGPVLASHSNCRALCDVRRNLSDDQLRAIRDTGGVVGLNIYHRFVHDDPAQQTVEMLARHAAHMVDVMGIEHVACGFDDCHFLGPNNDGVQGMADVSESQNLFSCLEKLGMSPQEQAKIARENFLRMFA